MFISSINPEGFKRVFIAYFVAKPTRRIEENVEMMRGEF